MALKRFTKQWPGSGSPVYTCRICKHVTRNVEGDEGDLKLCAHCYELAGLENLQSDEGAAALTPGYVEEIKQRVAQIEARGNGDAGWRATFPTAFPKAAA